MRVKRDGRVVRKLRDVRANAVGRRRVDLTIPPEILARARVKPGDSVEIKVTRELRIALMPLRPDWPQECSGRRTGCVRGNGHQGDCITADEVPS